MNRVHDLTYFGVCLGEMTARTIAQLRYSWYFYACADDDDGKCRRVAIAGSVHLNSTIGVIPTGLNTGLVRSRNPYDHDRHGEGRPQAKKVDAPTLFALFSSCCRGLGVWDV